MHPTPDQMPNLLSRGFEHEGWFIEEDQNQARLGFRFKNKIHSERSSFQDIAVYDTEFFGKMLTLDGLMMFTERDEFVYHEMLTHVPLCSLPNPESVLIIGGGDAGCLREVLRHPCVQNVIQCDIDERVTRVCADHFSWVKDAIAHPRAQIIFEDGVKFLERPENHGRFDLIIVDSTDPVGPGATLFLKAFYEKVAKALKPNGVLCAQTESPHWAAPLVASIYDQLSQAFAHVSGYLGMVPAYPSGTWSWAYASNGRQPFDHFDGMRAHDISKSSLYYNAEIHRAAFALPNFARRAIAGENPFANFQPAES